MSGDSVKVLLQQLKTFVTDFDKEIADEGKSQCDCPKFVPLYVMPCCPNPIKFPITNTSEEKQEPNEPIDTYDRYDNYYNNYNIDHKRLAWDRPVSTYDFTQKRNIDTGFTVFGTDPICDKNRNNGNTKGTSKKLNSVKLKLKPGNGNCGYWCTEIKCDSVKTKQKKKKMPKSSYVESFRVELDEKAPPCLYDLPCKAQCLNHPPGIKPSGQYS